MGIPDGDAGNRQSVAIYRMDRPERRIDDGDAFNHDIPALEKLDE